MKRMIAICAFLASTPATALELEFPVSATLGFEVQETHGSYALPVGSWSNGTIPVSVQEGAVVQQAWRLSGTELTTMQILDALRSQLVEAGFDIAFECDSTACGGFDFRFGTDILPEPDMHVDLGDFRFLSAKTDEEAVSLVISRSANSGFVQLIHVGPEGVAAPQLTSSTKTIPVATDPESVQGFGQQLEQSGSVVLEDLSFETGTSTLGGDNYSSVAALADYLQLNPNRKVALVGHTDAVGSLDGNIALSRRRAQAVVDLLTQQFGIAQSRLEAQGMGYLAPRSTNLTPDGREANRRVEVILTSTE